MPEIWSKRGADGFRFNGVASHGQDTGPHWKEARREHKGTLMWVDGEMRERADGGDGGGGGHGGLLPTIRSHDCFCLLANFLHGLSLSSPPPHLHERKLSLKEVKSPASNSKRGRAQF